MIPQSFRDPVFNTSSPNHNSDDVLMVRRCKTSGLDESRRAVREQIPRKTRTPSPFPQEQPMFIPSLGDDDLNRAWRTLQHEDILPSWTLHPLTFSRPPNNDFSNRSCSPGDAPRRTRPAAITSTAPTRLLSKFFTLQRQQRQLTTPEGGLNGGARSLTTNPDECIEFEAAIEEQCQIGYPDNLIPPRPIRTC